MSTLELTGNNLTIESFYHAMTNETVHITVSMEAWKKLNESREGVEKMLANKQVAYGVTTGFGSLKGGCASHDDQLDQLQHNIIVSHAVGTGPALPLYQSRGMLILRINTLIKGNSGVT